MAQDDNNQNKNNNQKKGGGDKQGGGKDISTDSHFFPEFLKQAIGNLATVFGHRGLELGFVTTILTFLTGFIGQEGTIQAINLLVAALQSSTTLQKLTQLMGWPPVLTSVFRETLDELFDGVREEYLAKGRLTHADANKVLGKTIKSLEERLDNEMTFVWAVQFLQAHEQESLTERITAFCADPADKQRWSVWEPKLNKLRLITPLLQIGVNQWRDHLSALFRDPVVTAKVTKQHAAVPEVVGKLKALGTDLVQNGPQAASIVAVRNQLHAAEDGALKAQKRTQLQRRRLQTIYHL